MWFKPKFYLGRSKRPRPLPTEESHFFEFEGKIKNMDSLKEEWNLLKDSGSWALQDAFKQLMSVLELMIKKIEKLENRIGKIKMEKHYLGDSVWAQSEETGIRLVANSGQTIYLSLETMAQLFIYQKAMLAELSEREDDEK